MGKQHVLSDGLSIYRRLQSDDQDSVRLLTVEDLIAIGRQLTPTEVKDQLLKQIRQTVSDKSWRVRYMAASHFNEVRFSSALSVVKESLIFRSIVSGGRWTRACPRRISWSLRSSPER